MFVNWGTDFTKSNNKMATTASPLNCGGPETFKELQNIVNLSTLYGQLFSCRWRYFARASTRGSPLSLLLLGPLLLFLLLYKHSRRNNAILLTIGPVVRLLSLYKTLFVLLHLISMQIVCSSSYHGHSVFLIIKDRVEISTAEEENWKILKDFFNNEFAESKMLFGFMLDLCKWLAFGLVHFMEMAFKIDWIGCLMVLGYVVPVKMRRNNQTYIDHE